MINKIYKYIIIFFFSLFLLILTILTFSSKTRHTSFNYLLNTYKIYKLVSLQQDLNNEYNIESANKKLINYLEMSKKIANGKSKLLIDLHHAVELVESKASSRNDYQILENFFFKLVEHDPQSYQARLWLAKSYFYQEKYKKSLVEVNKGIEINPVQSDIYRIAFQIANEIKDNALLNNFCTKYKNSYFGGSVNRYKSTFFKDNVINKIALEVRPEETTPKYYTHSGLQLNSFENYEFVLNKPKNIEGINLYLSFLPGVNFEIKNISIATENENLKLSTKDLFATSNNSFINNNSFNLNYLILTEGDEILNLKFNKKIKAVNKIILNAKFNKMDISNYKLCTNE